MSEVLFVGREREKDLYKQFLARETPWVLIITGLGGIGKTALLRRLAEYTLTEPTLSQTCVLMLDFAEETLRTYPLQVLDKLTKDTAPHCDLHQMDAEFTTHLQESLHQLTQLSTERIQTGVSESEDVALREIHHQMRELATEGLYAQLKMFTGYRLVLMLDTCEWLNDPEGVEVGQWILNELIPGIHTRIQQQGRQCSVVMASRVPPQLDAINARDQRRLTLSMLGKAEVDQYLMHMGLQDPALRQRIYEVTHGHALCVSIIGTSWKNQSEQQRPLTLADITELQVQEFSEMALMQFMNERVLKQLKSPFRELTRYGVLLRSFDLPLLRNVFPELLPEPEALERFHQLTRYPYIESRGNYRYAFHELVREALAEETQKEEPEEWRRYHKRALEYLTQVSPRSPDWYYHLLASDEKQGVGAWQKALQEARASGKRECLGALLQAALDKTLRLSLAACAVREFEQGRSYYYIQQWEAALKSYEQALCFFERIQDRPGQAMVAKAMGDMQRAQTRLDTAQQSYQKALSLYEIMGDRLGQAKVFQALGSIKQSRQELNEALDNYEQAFRLFGQVEDRLGQADMYKTIGDVQQASKKCEEALQSYSQAFTLYEESGSDRGKREAERARDELYALLESNRTRDQLHPVYVAASRADSEIAERLKADLQTRGIAVCAEREPIQPGTFDWEEALRSTIQGASAVVLIASPNAHSSRSVQETLRITEMYRRPVYLVWVAGVEWPDAAPQGLSERQYIDARAGNYSRALKEITVTLSRTPLAVLTPQEESIETAGPLREDFEPRNPYKSLRPFMVNDSRDYFGRDLLVNELITTLQEQLTAEKERLLAVVGPSGSGKSSVVMAGLLPRLQTGALPGSEQWVYLEPMVPGPHPLESLASILAPLLPDRSLKSISEDLGGDSTDSLHLLATTLTRDSGTKVVLFIDQFEELFTQTVSEDERKHFIDLLVTALGKPHDPVVVLLTLRADFYDRPMHYLVLGKLLRQRQSVILPMDLAELRAAIEKPASLPDVQLVFEDDLVSDLLFEIGEQAGALPLLQFTLDQLVQRRNGCQLTLQAYHEMDGVKGALSQHAEETYQALPSEEHRQMAREVFLRLVEPGITEQDTTRRRAAYAEFERADPVQTQQMHETLEAFTKARLLTTNQIGGQTTIEVSHEAVLCEWNRLTQWLREAREDIQFQQALTEDVTAWEQRQRPRARLYRGSQLKEAQAWARRNRPSKQEVTFLQASAVQRSLSLMGLLAIILLLVSSMGIAGYLYLSQPPNPTLVTTLQDTVDGSLRYCINKAPSGSVITFARHLKGTIELTGGDLMIDQGKQLTIVDPDPEANPLTITGGKSSAKIHVFQGSMLKVSGLSFNNSKMLFLGFLYNEGTLTVIKSTISGNKTIFNGTDTGGGIVNASTGILTVIKSIISNNLVGSENTRGGNAAGGGIFNDGKLTVTDSILQGNRAISSSGTGLGGGIYNSEAGIVMVTSSIFSNNLSSGKQNGQGGGIGNAGKMDVTASTFLNNTASGDRYSFGGGIYNSETGIITVTSNTFSNNSSSSKQNGQGGGIDNVGKLDVTASAFLNNTASGDESWGGGIANYYIGTITVTSSTFSNNSSSGKHGGGGGGIYSKSKGKLNVTASAFWSNTASGGTAFGGGGIAFGGAKDSIALIRFCLLYGNGSSAGGGIWVDPISSNQMTISNNIVAANSAHNGPDISGTLTSNGYNLLTNITGVTGLDTRTDRQVPLADLKIDSILHDDW